jgi:hypothetical protein
VTPTSCCAIHITLCSHETSADFRRTTRRYISEDGTLLNKIYFHSYCKMRMSSLVFRPQMDLVYEPLREKSIGGITGKGRLEYSEYNLCQLVHHKSYMDLPGILFMVLFLRQYEDTGPCFYLCTEVEISKQVNHYIINAFHWFINLPIFQRVTRPMKYSMFNRCIFHQDFG